jgi:hypothetical protein
LRPRSMLDLLLGLESRCPKVGCRVETDRPLPAALPVLSIPALSSLQNSLKRTGCTGRFREASRHANNHKAGRKKGTGEDMTANLHSRGAQPKVQCQGPVGCGHQSSGPDLTRHQCRWPPISNPTAPLPQLGDAVSYICCSRCGTCMQSSMVRAASKPLLPPAFALTSTIYHFTFIYCCSQ